MRMHGFSDHIRVIRDIRYFPFCQTAEIGGTVPSSRRIFFLVSTLRAGTRAWNASRPRSAMGDTAASPGRRFQDAKRPHLRYDAKRRNGSNTETVPLLVVLPRIALSPSIHIIKKAECQPSTGDCPVFVAARAPVLGKAPSTARMGLLPSALFPRAQNR